MLDHITKETLRALFDAEEESVSYLIEQERKRLGLADEPDKDALAAWTVGEGYYLRRIDQGGLIDEDVELVDGEGVARGGWSTRFDGKEVTLTRREK